MAFQGARLPLPERGDACLLQLCGQCMARDPAQRPPFPVRRSWDSAAAHMPSLQRLFNQSALLWQTCSPSCLCLGRWKSLRRLPARPALFFSSFQPLMHRIDAHRPS